MRIGILALQGAFVEHAQMLTRLGVETREVRQKRDFTDALDGLVIPGGESTVIGKLLVELGLFAPVKTAIEGGLPVLGTCAGLILLARSVTNDRAWLCTMDIAATRNAYGRQLGSFSCNARFEGVGDVPAVFIRAPYIASVGPNAQTLCTVDGHIVAARQGAQLVTAFHPELTDDTRIHAFWLRTCV